MVHVIVTHFIAPPLFGVAVVLLWRSLGWRYQLLLFADFIVFAELVRCVIYCVKLNGWHYITTDSETQLGLATSLAIQAVVGVAAWGATRLYIMMCCQKVCRN